MSILHVDTEIMAASAAKIENAIDEIDGLLGLLNQDVNTMLAGWSGDGASAHRTMHERFAKDAYVIRDSLRDMHDALVRTRTAYVTQESEQTGDQTVAAAQILA